jgi:cell division protein ZapA
MALVNLKVNGRDFPVSCEDGQEPRLRRLAQYIDSKVAEFTKSMGQVGEARLMLLAALVIADELSDANEALQQPRGRPASAVAEESAAVATGIHGIAQRIESIAARLETS